MLSSTPHSRPFRRLRDLLGLPFFILLHLIFTLSSVFKRVSEVITWRVEVSPSTRPPKHVALVFSSSSRQRQLQEAAVLVESVRRVVAWAGELGVEEVSVRCSGKLFTYQPSVRLHAHAQILLCSFKLRIESFDLFSHYLFPHRPRENDHPSGMILSRLPQKGLHNRTNIP
jgi:hypothetical protein